MSLARATCSEIFVPLDKRIALLLPFFIEFADGSHDFGLLHAFLQGAKCLDSGVYVPQSFVELVVFLSNLLEPFLALREVHGANDFIS